MLTFEKGARLCGRFTLVEKIGAGGHGEVWRAHDDRRASDVALKLLYPEVARAPGTWEGLQHEYAVSQRLGHPGLAEIFEPVRDDDATVLPMSLATGDLRRLRGEPYSRIVPALLEIARALDHAHRRGVVHGDLKPGNVLIGTEGQVVVADFGVAALDGERVSRSPGSPFSASPQQLEGEPPTPADDVYGLGALAYELLSGYPPFFPDFELRDVLGKPVPPLQPIHPLPARLSRLVMRMLAKDPAERPAGMVDVQEELEAALQDTIHDAADLPPLVEIGADADDLPGIDLGAVTGRVPVLATPPSPPEPPTLAPAPVDPPTLVPAVVVAADEPPAPAPAPFVAETIAVAEDSGDGAGDDEPRRRGAAALKWVVGGTLAAALVAVFVWLPRLAEQRAAEPVPAESSAAGSPAVPSAAIVAGRGESATAGDGGEPASAPESTSAALARASLEARFEEQQGKFDARLRELEDRAAGVWGGPAFAAAKALGADALGAMNAGEAEIAIDRSRVALQRLERVAESAAAAAEAQVDEGMQALSAGQTEVARRAFELALQIEPGNVRARAGIGRAGGLAPVLPTLADAEAALAAGEAARAVQLYREVLRADPGNAAAREGLARAEAASGDDQYSRHIGEALASLREKRIEQARSALERARALRPQGPEVIAGFRQIESLQAGQGLDEARRRATELEGQERWAEALAQYEALLARDPTLEFARAGKARVAPRAELAGRMQGLIDQPARLAAPEVRREAEALLARAKAVDQPGPVLRSQTTRLAELLPVYDTPVRVVLESDGATSVMIQRVGVLGSFSRQEVDLKPGRYVAVGTRAGYRDVRREFLVAPGEPREAIQVRCVEPLQ